MSDTWFKWDYVCPYCDSNIEMNIKSSGTYHNSDCPKCQEPMILMSVVDVTIQPKEKEEETMETPVQTMTLEWLENNETVTKTYTENDVRSMQWSNKSMYKKQNENYAKENQLRSYLTEVYSDEYIDKEEVIKGVAEIMDIPLTQEVEVTFNIQVTSTVEVDLTLGDDFDMSDFVTNNMTLDSYDSAISINDYYVENVQKG